LENLPPLATISKHRTTEEEAYSDRTMNLSTENTRNASRITPGVPEHCYKTKNTQNQNTYVSEPAVLATTSFAESRIPICVHLCSSAA